MPLRDVSPRFDVVNVSFAEPTSPTSGVMQFTPDGSTTEADFRAGMQALKARGQKVLISIGGANGQVQLTTASARNNFVTTMIDIIETYGFDGMDIDFEGHSLSFDFGDEDFRNPTTPLIVNTISAVRQICDHFGPDFLLTMAPETFFVQLGYRFYGGISPGADRRAGAYLPLIHALRDKLTFLQVQHYNSGPISGLDDQFYLPGVANFHVAMVDMLLKGFPIAGDSGKFFPPLRQDQVLIGLPATGLAGGGFTPVNEVQRALDCLVKAVNCASYNPGQSYPNLRGLMTWSINWDRFNNFEFSSSHRDYLDTLP
ncbi:chitinase [Exilibacterium tricleocarpae]|uniref:chitinase n=2 Tax=Exilibacterium tricleocarpae TaxID=2591008 RepID=A0A545SRY2_9GAMM|nr:chitinase [Exilibacterium tricleocarpae]